jgi:hypothetical protein
MKRMLSQQNNATVQTGRIPQKAVFKVLILDLIYTEGDLRKPCKIPQPTG